ncbi:MAG: serine/threonine protein kinase [Deltaproteobacteria bacterium]|nr:serine/threonine protein kinase [Deltaproteobacteria bacterium]
MDDDVELFTTELPSEALIERGDPVASRASGGAGIAASIAGPIEPTRAPVRWLDAAGARYAPGDPIGRGGMGEVVLCRDLAVGRDVAMKLIRDRARVRPEVEARFVHEARVQGQLEHPAIVPVYDVGLNADGALYFTMKHVRGVSLAEVLRGLRAGDAALAQRYSRRRLLTVFSQICMAVHFAHEKGVVHRDLKPANIMLGGFGEAYLLDWGLALAPEAAPEVVHDRAAVGTPGYMAPEQIEGADAAPIDARADVYALGVILFELLTHERVIDAPAIVDVLRATLALDGARPAARAPDADVPPELDALCYRATRRDPAARIASAAALSAGIEAYLDGDRDLALRWELARGHADEAAAALTRARAAPATEQAERARAMRDVAAALGLDPNQVDAQRTLVRLIAEPLTSVPPAAEAELAASAGAAFQFARRSALAFYAGYLLYLPLLLWMGVRDVRLFALGWATIAACIGATVWLVRRPPTRRGVPLAHLALSTVTVGTASVMFGPFVLVPMLAGTMCVCYTASVGTGRGLVPIAGCVSVLAPAGLAWLGVIPSCYAFEDGRWSITSQVFDISSVPTQLFLVLASFGTIAPACVFVARLRRAYLDGERRLQLQAWQLRQIMPDAT